MSDYCTAADVRNQIVTTKVTADSLLSQYITEASKFIDIYCRRTFVTRTETRTYDAVQDVVGNVLYLDTDLIGVITLTNGDSEVLDATTYVLLPANEYPKYAIKLKAGSSKSWAYNTDPEEAISVNGTWGYQNSTAAPADIQRATARLAAWYYQMRQAPFENTGGLNDLNQTAVTSSIPNDILDILTPYKRAGVTT